MLDAQIHSLINRLGVDQKKIVLKFLKGLFNSTSETELLSSSGNSDESREQAIGFMKGKIEMKPNFDEPIDEFFNPL